MDTYRDQDGTLISAVQWFPNSDSGDDAVWSDRDGKNANRPYVITVNNERAYLESGDWIIAEQKRGYFRVCKPDRFNDLYTPV